MSTSCKLESTDGVSVKTPITTKDSSLSSGESSMAYHIRTTLEKVFSLAENTLVILKQALKGTPFKSSLTGDVSVYDTELLVNSFVSRKSNTHFTANTEFIKTLDGIEDLDYKTFITRKVQQYKNEFTGGRNFSTVDELNNRLLQKSILNEKLHARLAVISDDSLNQYLKSKDGFKDLFFDKSGKKFILGNSLVETDGGIEFANNQLNELITWVVKDEVNAWVQSRKYGKILDLLLGLVMTNDPSVNTFYNPGLSVLFDTEAFNLFIQSDDGSIVPKSDDKFWYMIDTDQIPHTTLVDFMNKAYSFKNTLKLKPSDTVYSQQLLHSSEELLKNQDELIPVVAVADLIIVRENGDVEIIDYKTSTKNLGSEYVNDKDTWDIAKRKSAFSQLYVESILLQQHGIPHEKIKTNILPIQLLENLLISKTADLIPLADGGSRTLLGYFKDLDKIIFIPLENVVINLLSNNFLPNVDSINIGIQINNKMNWTPKAILKDSNAISFRDKWTANFGKLFPTSSFLNNKPLLNDAYIQKEFITKSGNKYILKGSFNKNLRSKSFDTIDDATDYFKKWYSNDASLAKLYYDTLRVRLQTVFDEVKQANNDTKEWENIHEGIVAKSGGYNEFIQRQFTYLTEDMSSVAAAPLMKYIMKPGWEIFEIGDNPEINTMLGDFNIIPLCKKDPVTKEIVFDLIDITALNFDMVIDLPFGNNLLGNVSKALPDVKANLANIEKVKLLLLSNHIVELYEGTEYKAKANNIIVLNQTLNKLNEIFEINVNSELNLFSHISRGIKSKSFLNTNTVISSERLLEDTVNTLVSMTNYMDHLKGLPENVIVTPTNIVGPLTSDKSTSIKSRLKLLLDNIDIATGKNPFGMDTMVSSPSLLWQDIWDNHVSSLINSLEPLTSLMNDGDNTNLIEIGAFTKSTNIIDLAYKKLTEIVATKNGIFQSITDLEARGKWGVGSKFTEDKKSLLQLWRDRELLNGTMINTLDLAKSTSGIHSSLNRAMDEVRTKYGKYKNKLNRLLFNKGAKNNLNTTMNIFSWDRYIDKSSDEKIKAFMFKNPETDNTLDQQEKEFLTEYLNQMNMALHFDAKPYEVVIKETANRDEINRLKNSGEWYQIPLVRLELASTVVKGLKRYLKDPKEISKSFTQALVDENGEIREELLTASTSNFLLMHTLNNPFKLTANERTRHLDDANNNDKGLTPENYYSINMEYILDNVMSALFKQLAFNPVISKLKAAIATATIRAAALGKDIATEIDFIYQTIDSSIYNKSFAPPNDSVNIITTAMKGVAAKATLAFNMMSFARECIAGFFLNMLLAMVNSLEPEANRPTFMDVVRAYKIVITDILKLPANITLLEKIDNQLGITQLGIFSLEEAQSYYKNNFTRFSDMALWTSRSPDFLNRMVTVVSFMVHNGSFEAYSLDEDQELVYDWKKDKRFDKLATGDKSNMSEYLRQLALYSYIMDQHVNDGKQVFDEKIGFRAIRWNGNFEDSNNDLLTFGITLNEANNMIQIANMSFGYMDNSVKSLLFKTSILGRLIMFQTHIPALIQRWVQLPGQSTKLGAIVQMVDQDGNFIYEYPTEDGEVEYVTYDHVIEADGSKTELKPVFTWKTNPVEGYLWSVMDTASELKRHGFQGTKSFLAENTVKRRLLILALTSFLVAVAGPLFLAFDVPDKDEDDVLLKDSWFKSFMSTMLFNISEDHRVWSRTALFFSLNFQAVGIITRLFKSTFNVMFKEDYPIEQYIQQFGLFAPARDLLKRRGSERRKELRAAMLEKLQGFYNIGGQQYGVIQL